MGQNSEEGTFFNIQIPSMVCGILPDPEQARRENWPPTNTALMKISPLRRLICTGRKLAFASNRECLTIATSCFKEQFLLELQQRSKGLNFHKPPATIPVFVCPSIQMLFAFLKCTLYAKTHLNWTYLVWPLSTYATMAGGQRNGDWAQGRHSWQANVTGHF